MYSDCNKYFLAKITSLILSDINDPVSDVSQSTPASVDQSKVDTLVTFGFSEEVARNALMATVLVFILRA